MCTGRPPFRAATHAGRAQARVPRTRRGRSARSTPRCREWLCDIIAKLHAKDPADRFQSAAEVAELLAEYLAGIQDSADAPLKAKLRSRRGRSGRWKWAVAALALLLAGGLVATGITHLLRGRTPAHGPLDEGAPTTAPPPRNQGDPVPAANPVGEPVDSRAYLPLSEGALRRVTDFAEIHAATPEEVMKWAQSLGPEFTVIALGDHPTAKPPQVHAIAVKLAGQQVDSKLTFGLYAKRGALIQPQMDRDRYRAHHIQWYEFGKQGIYDFSLWLRDPIPMFHGAFPNRDLALQLAAHRKQGYKPVLLLPCHLPNPGLTAMHYMPDSGRHRWRAEADLPADWLATFAENARRDDLFVSLASTIRTSAGDPVRGGSVGEPCRSEVGVQVRPPDGRVRSRVGGTAKGWAPAGVGHVLWGSHEPAVRRIVGPVRHSLTGHSRLGFRPGRRTWPGTSCSTASTPRQRASLGDSSSITRLAV